LTAVAHVRQAGVDLPRREELEGGHALADLVPCLEGRVLQPWVTRHRMIPEGREACMSREESIFPAAWGEDKRRHPRLTVLRAGGAGSAGLPGSRTLYQDRVTVGAPWRARIREAAAVPAGTACCPAQYAGGGRGPLLARQRVRHGAC